MELRRRTGFDVRQPCEIELLASLALPSTVSLVVVILLITPPYVCHDNNTTTNDKQSPPKDWLRVYTQIGSIFGEIFGFFCTHRTGVGPLFEAISVRIRVLLTRSRSCRLVNDPLNGALLCNVQQPRHLQLFQLPLSQPLLQLVLPTR